MMEGSHSAVDDSAGGCNAKGREKCQRTDPVLAAGGARPGFRRRPEALRSVVPGSAENET